MSPARILTLLPALLLTLALVPGTAGATLANPPDPALAVSLALQGGQARVDYDRASGLIRFIGAEPGYAVSAPMRSMAGVSPQTQEPAQAALAFLAANAASFGLNDPGGELRVSRLQAEGDGRSFVRLQQHLNGVPILGAEAVVQLRQDLAVVSASSRLQAGVQVNTAPAIAPSAALGTAQAAVAAQYGVDAASLDADPPALWVYAPKLLGVPGASGPALVWRTEVRSAEPPIREFVLVDAQLGVIALQFSEIETFKDRRIYDNADISSALPGTGPVRTETGPAAAYDEANLAFAYAGDVYDWYWQVHGRDSIDGLGMPLIQTVRYCRTGSCPYPNAYWSGSQMVYGRNFARARDVVAHEMTHGVTEHESGLIYFWQSGAISEHLSDVWGEVIEHWKSPSADPGWLLGEDLAPYVAQAPFRSMSNPPEKLDPDRMTSPYYSCDPSFLDSGGVHTNSGVGNKAAYLIARGGPFNGQTVTGIGITKLASIYYEAQTHLLTSAADYQDLYNGLQQACANLTGPGGITAADCQEVKKALDAVEMNLQPPSCAAPEAPVCPAGTVAENLWSDDLEDPANSQWQTQLLSGADMEWHYPQTSNPHSFDATYATSGVLNLWGYDKAGIGDYAIQMKPAVGIPVTGSLYMRFNHSYMFDGSGPYRDGGVVEYSANGGPWQDAGSCMDSNGYNATLAVGTGNPLAARQAFGSTSRGYVSTRLNLATLAGQNVRFRFRLGTDNTNGAYGWFVDDVRIYQCVARTPLPSRVWLPMLTKATPAPLAGPWASSGGVSTFAVSADRARVQNYTIRIDVAGCGLSSYPITHAVDEPITDGQFSFGGSFYASGTFRNPAYVIGQTGLNQYPIPDCGLVSTGAPASILQMWQGTASVASPPIAAFVVAPESQTVLTAQPAQ